jgi:hypothetical protein
MCNWLLSVKKTILRCGRVARRQNAPAVLLAGFVASTLLSGAALGQPQAAPAPAPENTFEITPFVGYIGGGEFEDPTTQSARDVDADTNLGLFLNLNSGGPDRQYELLYSQQGTVIQGEVPIDLDIQYLQIGGIVNFTDVEHAIPFFGITVGATQFNPDGPGLDDETKLSFSVGGGVKMPITRHIGLRLDARAFVTLLDSDADIFCISGTEAASCRIAAKSDTFVQYTLGLGVVAAF